MTPEEEFNSLPDAVRRLCMFFLEGGFGERGADWIAMFGEYVDLRRTNAPIPYRITEAGRKALEGK